MTTRVFLIAGLASGLASASPATFVTALPVAKDQLLVRFNAQPVFSTRGFHGVQFPVNMGYGLTSRWGLFANVNQGFGSLNGNSARLSSYGSSDTLFYARYTLYKRDRPGSTFRIAPLAGGYVPTGSNSLRGPQGLLPKALQTGSGSFDPYAGITMGFTNSRVGFACDSTYRHNPGTSGGISPGDQFRADGQAELKVYPVHMPEEGLPHLVIVTVESNYSRDGRDLVNGVTSRNSGGQVLRMDSVVELSTLRWQIGMGAQLPVMQDLSGTGRMKQRSGYFLFFEYYLAAPNWRHARTRT